MASPLTTASTTTATASQTSGSAYPMEWCADHNKKFPVTLPENQNLAFGAWWSGSPYMGDSEQLSARRGRSQPQ